MAHDGVEIDDVFHKDGDTEVSSYKQGDVNKLLRTATKERQAGFSFLSPSVFAEIQRAAEILRNNNRIERRVSQPPQGIRPIESSSSFSTTGITARRSVATGRPYVVRTVNTGFVRQVPVHVGQVFYKDGDVEVTTYNATEVNTLLRTATPARQASFQFINMSDLTSCHFTAARDGRGHGPYIVSTIDAFGFLQAGMT
jgi:hypothetical protein